MLAPSVHMCSITLTETGLYNKTELTIIHKPETVRLELLVFFTQGEALRLRRDNAFFLASVLCDIGRLLLCLLTSCGLISSGRRYLIWASLPRTCVITTQLWRPPPTNTLYDYGGIATITKVGIVITAMSGIYDTNLSYGQQIFTMWLHISTTPDPKYLRA